MAVFALALFHGGYPDRAAAGQLTVSWDKNTEPTVTGYRIHYGTAPGKYGASLDVGNVTTYTITGLEDGKAYHVAVSAVDSYGSEGPYSTEVSRTTPVRAKTGGLDPRETARSNTAPPAVETLSRPGVPVGPVSLSAGVAYPYSTHGAISSSGDAVQYRFSWSDGTVSEWLPVGVLETTKGWAAAGTYTQVHAQARCATHQAVVSAVSDTLTVAVAATDVAETISPPSTPSGATSLAALTTSAYRAGGAVSSSGDQIEYRFLWSDGTTSAWLAAGVLEASKSWSAPGTYEVRAQARCALHPSVVSQSETALVVSITPGTAETLSEPSPPAGPAEGLTGYLLAYGTGGSASSVDDAVHYRFDWGDGTVSDWLAADTANQAQAWKFWPAEGAYAICSVARCSTHVDLAIQSADVEVLIDRGDPRKFFDSFPVEPAADDASWRIVSGGWATQADETFAADTLQSDNLAVVNAIPDFSAGRIAARLKIAGDPADAYASIVFALADAGRYRYAALAGTRLYLGQIGDTTAEPGGIKASAPVQLSRGAWNQVRLDISQDGEVTAYFGQSQTPVLKYRFGDAASGQVGCAANTAGVVFDDFGVWDERVLLP